MLHMNYKNENLEFIICTENREKKNNISLFIKTDNTHNVLHFDSFF